MTRSLLSILCLSFLFLGKINAQNPLKFSTETKDLGNGQADLICTFAIQDGWKTYSQFLESEDGPVATSLTFKEGAHFKLIGKPVEGGEKKTIFDPVFGMNLTVFKHKATFTQRIQILDASKPVVGFVEAMTCDDAQCLPPKQFDFAFKLPAPSAAPLPQTPTQNPAQTPQNQQVTPQNNGKTEPPKSGNGQAVMPIIDPQKTIETPQITPPETQIGTANPIAAIDNPLFKKPDDPDFQGFFEGKREINAAAIVNQCGVEAEKPNSLWKIFAGGFVGGLLALLTPCVFPMLPMTVGFFTKGGRDKKKGLRDALIYGLSIIVLYTGVGIGLVSAFGPTVLNEMASNVWFNLAFFIVFLIFALSFFGLFEITLPASWSTKTDKLADQGGFLGIFFMAATLAIVSFSCTGPIVGTLLVQTAQGSSSLLFGRIPIEPVIGMFGFSLALALPFALFAAFPAWLKSMPKSGGWMDNVKITLGFLELALAFKFLSTADLVRHWGVLKFELFLGIWILLALLLAAYQFGFLKKLKGASGKLSIGRIIVGGLSLFFGIYMINGLAKYEAMSALSGIAPPVHYNFFRPQDCPHGLNCFTDFDEAAAFAKKVNKPLFVDFTGHSCVNCRKMEENIWVKPGILKYLEQDYVVVSLYVDDDTQLFPGDKFKYLLDPRTGDKIKDVGDKWSSFQVNNFAVTAQPLYVLMAPDGKTVLTAPVPYTPDVDKYQAFLECGKQGFEKYKLTSAPVLGAK
jgi:thiol:disulfide interchange protein